MPLLSRFRKPGGFQQLLALIETCEASKQKDLLQLIGSEDPGWAHLVNAKRLTFEKILRWPREILMEITPHLSDQVLAVAYHMSLQMTTTRDEKPEEKWLESLPFMKSAEVRALAKDQMPSLAEQSSATIKIIRTVRDLESSGKIRFSSFDSSLEIDRRLAS